MRVNSCSSTLAQANKDLSLAWQEAQAHWRDAKAGEFEREYLAEIPVVLAKSREAMEELDRFLLKVRTACE